LHAQSSQHNAVAVRVRGAGGPHLASIVGALPGVARVEVLEQADDRARLQVFPVNDAKLVGPVSNMARERGWEVEEIYVERGRLDDVFRDVTMKAARPTS
ncbi:MAG: ABC transporter ATP-binding protein, partial [Gammaproteobacteria bacterium]